MISKRSRPAADLTRFFALIPAMVADNPVTLQGLIVLCATDTLQRATNEFPTAKAIGEFTGRSEGTVLHDVEPLIELGFIQKAAGGYNVTAKAEYFIRGLEITYARRIQDKHKWRCLGKGDPRSEFIRNPARLGTKFLKS